VVVSHEFHATVAQDRVIRQSPGGNQEVEPGSTVTIVVSRGPESSPTPSPTASPTPTDEPNPTPTEDGLGF